MIEAVSFELAVNIFSFSVLRPRRSLFLLTYDRVHGIDRDPSVDYNALKRKSAEREDKTYGTRIYQSRGLRDTEPYTEQGTTGAADEIRTYAQDMAQKELQGEVRYDADVRGTSGTLPNGTEESTGRD